MRARELRLEVPGRPIRRVQTRLAGIVAVLAISAGIPSALISTGAVPPLSGLARALAHPTTVEHLMRRPIDDLAAASLLWLAAWGAWIWLTLCLALEVSARFRGRPSIRLPGSRGAQSMVAFVVGAALTVGGAQRHSAPARPQVVETASTCNPGLGETAPAAPGRGPSSSLGSTDGADTAQLSNPTTRYVVKAGDSLWSIASDQLGSPFQWRRIAELNYERLQPDGGRLLDDHWIRPGWVFELPAPARTQDAAANSPVGPMSVLSLPSALPAPALAPAGPAFSATRAERSQRSARPSFGGIGRAETGAGAVHTEAAGAGHRHHSESSGRSHRASPARVPIAPIGFGILGAGIIALLDRMRRAQQRRRPTGLRIALPGADVAELERGLRLAADSGSAEWVDLGLRLLSTLVRRHRLTTPHVAVVRVRPDAIEFIFDARQTTPQPPPPFEAWSHSNSWFLRTSRSLAETLRDDDGIVATAAPLPALVTLGRDEHGLLLVDLERAGSLEISGPESEPLVQAIAVELATASWAEQVDVVLVGFDSDIRGLERLSLARSPSSVRSRLERKVRERRTLLALAKCDTNVEARWIDEDGAWDLSLVICSSSVLEDDRAGLEAIVELAGDGSLGIGVVCVAADSRARWRASVDNGRVTLQGAGAELSSLAAQEVPDDFIEQVGSLVAVASETAGIGPNDPPYDSLTIDHALSVTHLGAEADRDVIVETGRPEVEVQVLGPVRVIGAARPFTRAFALELVVYLALHRSGARNEQWATALWPDRAMSPTTLHSTASAARRSLGVSASGEDHLPRAHGRLGLGPGVRTDWDHFVELSGSTRPSDWRRALELIRGRPFEELRGTDWAVLEGILASVEAVVVDVATRYSEHCLSVSPAGAEWGARQGLRVSAYDERLYRVLMKAADASGNPAGVERVMTELVRLVADEVEPFDAVHPETLSLYRQLSRRGAGPRRP